MDSIATWLATATVPESRAAGGLAPSATDKNYRVPGEGHEDEFLKLGLEVYSREGFCGTCHQPDGMGLPEAGFRHW